MPLLSVCNDNGKSNGNGNVQPNQSDRCVARNVRGRVAARQSNRRQPPAPSNTRALCSRSRGSHRAETDKERDSSTCPLLNEFQVAVMKHYNNKNVPYVFVMVATSVRCNTIRIQHGRDRPLDRSTTRANVVRGHLVMVRPRLRDWMCIVRHGTAGGGGDDGGGSRPRRPDRRNRELVCFVPLQHIHVSVRACLRSFVGFK